MKTTLILWCLHGNPGRFEDFSIIQESLRPNGIELKELKFNFDSPGETLKPIGANDAVLAYSWGSYALLKSIESRTQNFTNPIFMVAPFLNSSKPLSGFARALMKTPILAPALIGLSWKKWSLDFKNRMFLETEVAAGKDYLDWIQSSEVWMETLSRKVFQDSHPVDVGVSKSIKGPVRILVGPQDRIVGLEEIKLNFKNLNLNPQVKTLGSGGHALPWTHPEDISKWILNDGGFLK